MNHYDALRQLMPVDLGGIDATTGIRSVNYKDMSLEGALLDGVAAAIDMLPAEFFPSTVDALIGRWEAEYGVNPAPSSGLEQRRYVLLARYVYVGSMTKRHFEALADALGYKVNITEGGEVYAPFRAGISKAGDPVYAPAAMWTWKVTTIDRWPEPDIKTLFTELTPPPSSTQMGCGINRFFLKLSNQMIFFPKLHAPL
jgi:uncharacterized protein YmfQ (DUF2313 family)